MKRRLFLATAGVLIAVSAVTLSVILPRIQERTFPDRMMNRAIALAHEIPDALARDTAFATLASHLARAGNFIGAKRALKEIRDAEVRCQTQLATANALAKAGRLSDAERMFAAAVRSAKNLKESNRRSYTLSEVATAMAEVASREPFTSLR